MSKCWSLSQIERSETIFMPILWASSHARAVMSFKRTLGLSWSVRVSLSLQSMVRYSQVSWIVFPLLSHWRFHRMNLAVCWRRTLLSPSQVWFMSFPWAIWPMMAKWEKPCPPQALRHSSVILWEDQELKAFEADDKP